MMSMSKEAKAFFTIVSSILTTIICIVVVIAGLLYIIRLIPVCYMDEVMWGIIFFIIAGATALCIFVEWFDSLMEGMEAKEQKDWHDTHPF